MSEVEGLSELGVAPVLCKAFPQREDRKLGSVIYEAGNARNDKRQGHTNVRRDRLLPDRNDRVAHDRRAIAVCRAADQMRREESAVRAAGNEEPAARRDALLDKLICRRGAVCHVERSALAEEGVNEGGGNANRAGVIWQGAWGREMKQ